VSPIQVIYENGVFRPLSPVELPEGARVKMIIIEQSDLIPEEANGLANTTGPAVGEDLVALLDQVAALPYTPHPDAQTDVSSRHDDFLYPKDGKLP
jgi:predicted DNA-binding antitoxin AbrB/MazE fold protein